MNHSSLTPRRSAARVRHAASGFTLTEILIAIALIVAVVALAVANLGTILTGGQTDVAKSFVTSVIDTPLMAYRTTTGTFPTTEQGLKALIVAPEGVSGWRGPYLQQTEVPKDPWGTEYHYAYPGTHRSGSYDAWSAGPNKIDGDADDITNWTP